MGIMHFQVADLQNGMADLYLNQAEADDLLAFLALDYTRMLGIQIPL